MKSIIMSAVHFTFLRKIKQCPDEQNFSYIFIFVYIECTGLVGKSRHLPQITLFEVPSSLSLCTGGTGSQKLDCKRHFVHRKGHRAAG